MQGKFFTIIVGYGKNQILIRPQCIDTLLFNAMRLFAVSFSRNQEGCFTLTGQLLMQGALQGNTLSINPVRAGLYVLEITTQNTGERSYFKIEKL